MAEEKERKEKEIKTMEKIRKLQDDQLYINHRFNNLIVSPRFEDKNLENYEIVNEDQAKAVETARWFIENHDRCTGLIFIGKTGTGKNHLASAIGREVAKTKTVLMIEALKIIRSIKESWQEDSMKNHRETDLLKSLADVHLLIIDELGVQFGSDTEKLYLTEIINDRYNYKKPTILIGNVTIPELEKIIGDRALDRFREGGRVSVFSWKNWRGRQGNSFE